MKRLSAVELKDLRDKGDIKALWNAAIPYVKFAASTLRTHDKEEMLQEGLLGIEKDVRNWDPAKGKFQSHIMRRARWAMLKYLRRVNAGPDQVDLQAEPAGDEEVGMSYGSATVSYSDTDHTPEGFEDPAVQISRMCAAESAEKLLGLLPDATSMMLREINGLPIIDGQDDPQTTRDTTRSRGMARSSFYLQMENTKDFLDREQQIGQVSNADSLRPPKGRESWATNSPADRRYPGFWQGLAGAMGDTDAWRESVGGVWKDWSWKPTDVDVMGGAKR